MYSAPVVTMLLISVRYLQVRHSRMKIRSLILCSRLNRRLTCINHVNCATEEGRLPQLSDAPGNRRALRSPLSRTGAGSRWVSLVFRPVGRNRPVRWAVLYDTLLSVLGLHLIRLHAFGISVINADAAITIGRLRRQCQPAAQRHGRQAHPTCAGWQHHNFSMALT
jgi:hypothetical protein